MSTQRELVKVLDDYLVDYSVTVDWVKFRKELTEIKGILEEKCEYFLSDGTCVCRYCGSVLGDEWEDK